ncbi:hypothetical protein B0H65DRAFT_238584 [Neurospora tetraspora]|uniref:PI-PLC Y-box domain-containing protein n=1 Tax=Neurospora tetraspora TaxID=94610 RepID=A0AAE0MQR5_9PEZI|nr:hypothetical protein B0H65DRAFT_238584 [Neurospora tetraspora]
MPSLAHVGSGKRTDTHPRHHSKKAIMSMPSPYCHTSGQGSMPCHFVDVVGCYTRSTSLYRYLKRTYPVTTYTQSGSLIGSLYWSKGVQVPLLVRCSRVGSFRPLPEYVYLNHPGPFPKPRACPVSSARQVVQSSRPSFLTAPCTPYASTSAARRRGESTRSRNLRKASENCYWRGIHSKSCPIPGTSVMPP